MSIRIITDSASELSCDESRNLTVLPMRITFGTEEFRDGVDLSHRQFYERLIESDELPKTSMISMTEFSDAIGEARQKGEEVLVVTMSSALSGTFQSARAAAEAFDGGVRVVDSKTVCIGETILLEYAFRLIDGGAGLDEVADELERKKEDIRVIALLDTLEYLRRGGRVSNVAGVIGGILSVKPVIAIRDGVVEVLGKARGSKNGNNLLNEHIARSGGVDFSMPLMLGYSGLSEELLDKYVEDSAALWRDKTDHLDHEMIGGTIGTHAGPGAIAVGFFCVGDR